jgi:hypothetical protein
LTASLLYGLAWLLSSALAGGYFPKGVVPFACAEYLSAYMGSLTQHRPAMVKLAKCWRATQMHCCQMAEFWATGLKNGPVKLLASLEISGLESGPIPNFLIAA